MIARVSCAAAIAASALLAARAQSPSGGISTLRYVPGSTAKVQQLVGEEDKERRQATLTRTASRYGVEGTDLGYSFEHDGRAYFLFGDTVGTIGRAADSIATTDTSDPEAGARLEFLMTDGPTARGRRGRAIRPHYLTIEPAGISMGAFEVPVSGLSLNHRLHVVVSTNHSDDRTTDRSVLTTFVPPNRFEPGRTISQLPGGHFVKMSLHLEPSPIERAPAGGPFVLMWGTGQYRQSDAYFALVPAAQFERGGGTFYFTGADASGVPTWSGREADAVPVVRNGTLGDVSVTWCAPLRLWLMTYDSRPPAVRGVLMSYARSPWGPWSEPQLIFEGRRDNAVGRFIHNPRATPPDGLAGPVIGRGTANPEGVTGGAYAPYVVERWTRVQGNELTIYYVLSTWNPYVVVLMRSRFGIN